MRHPLHVLLLCLLSLSGCALRGVFSTSRPTPANDNSAEREAARQLSDSMADDLVNNRRAALLAKMERELRDATGAEAFNLAVDQMLAAYGSPVEAEYRMDEIGTKTYPDGRSKPMRKFWYAVRTTAHERGSHFLFIEVTTDEQGPAGSSFAIVTFPAGVPPALQ